MFGVGFIARGKLRFFGFERQGFQPDKEVESGHMSTRKTAARPSVQVGSYSSSIRMLPLHPIKSGERPSSVQGSEYIWQYDRKRSSRCLLLFRTIPEFDRGLRFSSTLCHLFRHSDCSSRA